MLSLHDAFLYTFCMALVIFACRALPFIVFKNIQTPSSDDFTGKFIAFVERVAPPVTMTVLTFNAVSMELLNTFAAGNRAGAVITAAASAFTTLLHIWKRSALVSIAGGTVLYVFMTALIPL